MQSDNLKQASPELAAAVDAALRQHMGSSGAGGGSSTVGSGGGGGTSAPSRSGDGGVGDLLPDGLIAAEGDIQVLRGKRR